MKRLPIVAFDLSLTATGYATRGTFGVLRPLNLQGVERLRWIRDYVLQLSEGMAVVVLEGYSFGSGNRAHALGELGGVIRLALYEAKLPTVIIPPSCRAKYATGKGNAPKEQVLAEAIRRLRYPGHDNNEADAMWLFAMAADHYAQPQRTVVPAAHRATLKSIEWPVLDGGK